MDMLQVCGNKLTKLPPLHKNLSFIHCSVNVLTQLSPDLSSLTKLVKLWCSDNKLTELPPLPNQLHFLSVSKNCLTQLPPLPQDLKVLECWDNPMTSLPQLPQTLKRVWVSPWQVISCLNNLTNPLTKVIIYNTEE